MAAQPESTDVGLVAKSLMLSRSAGLPPSVVARSLGASSRAIGVLEKAAVPAISTGDGPGEVLADWQIASSAFFTSLRTSSVFFALLDRGLRRIPLRTSLGIVSASANGWIVGEGKPIPVSTIAMLAGGVEPSVAAALVVATDETLRAMDPAANNLLLAELRKAVSAAVDVKFWELIEDEDTDLGASGGTFAADTQALLAAVNTTGTGPLVWVMAPDVANKAAAEDEDMTPLGGAILGLSAVVSDTVPAGTLRLVNGAALAGNAEAIRLDTSEHATIEMADNPTQDAGAPTAANLVSMFQTNSTALRALVPFAAVKTRANAWREITGITWSGS